MEKPFPNTFDKSDRQKFDEMFGIPTEHEKTERASFKQYLP
jgi:hypothetical protein